MRPLGLVELERPGHRVQHAVRDAVEFSAFELGAVVDADPGQHRDFLPAQARDAPGGQEVADVIPAVHTHQATFAVPGMGGAAITWDGSLSRTAV